MFVVACNTSGTHARHRMGGRSQVVSGRTVCAGLRALATACRRLRTPPNPGDILRPRGSTMRRAGTRKVGRAGVMVLVVSGLMFGASRGLFLTLLIPPGSRDLSLYAFYALEQEEAARQAAGA